MACNCIPAYCAGAPDFSQEPGCVEWRTRNCGRPETPWEDCPRLLDLNQQFQQGSVSRVLAYGIGPHEHIRYNPANGGGFEVYCDDGFTPVGRTGGFTRCVQLFHEGTLGEFFTSAAIGTAELVARGAAAIASGGTSIALEAASTYLKANEVQAMGLNIGDILSGVGQIAGGFESGDYLSALSGAANIGAGFFAPTPVAAPTYGIMPYGYPPAAPAPMATPTASTLPQLSLGAKSLMRLLLPIITKIASFLGLKSLPTLKRVMGYIRGLAKTGLGPAAVAAALGITVDELARLIIADKQRKRRRMNPANSKALRRAARRIRSFHRMCGHIDLLKGRSRHRAMSYAGPRCSTCKKNPCRC